MLLLLLPSFFQLAMSSVQMNFTFGATLAGLGDETFSTIIAAQSGWITAGSCDLTMTAGTAGSVYWDDLAISLFNTNTHCQASWGGYVGSSNYPETLFPNRVGILGALSGLVSSSPLSSDLTNSGGVAFNKNFYVAQGDEIEVGLRNTYTSGMVFTGVFNIDLGVSSPTGDTSVCDSSFTLPSPDPPATRT